MNHMVQDGTRWYIAVQSIPGVVRNRVWWYRVGGGRGGSIGEVGEVSG